ncbi:MAG TPA: hypothetical protein PL033_05340 [Candidatus Brocadiia bacterium]|nr:hypothetical protein [Candidatus Brocadiia bacterium]
MQSARKHKIRRILTVGLVVAAAVAWLAVASADQHEDMISADWIAQDGQFSSGRKTVFSLEHTREVLRRVRALAGRFHVESGWEIPEGFITELEGIETQADKLFKEAEQSENARKDLYFKARRILRRIAFSNPLLDFDSILFIKRHRPKGVYHMCDQFYGFNAVPGGGLFALRDAFGPKPQLVNLLAGSVVENGRLAGQKLDSGSFLSPELSFDGKTIFFAYSEAKGKDLEWSKTTCFHIFKVNSDGSGLRQLTDGEWDDFDPCLLPDGRIVFTTERRGGYLRCGRVCPVYALFSMNQDGGDIAPFSMHETHEWQPSVANDGMVVYTRWDYVDRDTNIAHHIWNCFPDGRDPRSPHGNYPKAREKRPWMEMDIRAIPGSHKFVATTGAHHGNAFGSLVIIDPRKEDDGAMSQLTRLTPEVPFPEAEGRPIENYSAYATAWPLGERDFLCVYDAKCRTHGIYWIDDSGNRELIYRDPEIPCLSPIPFRPRPVPPRIADMTSRAGGGTSGTPLVSAQAGLKPASTDAEPTTETVHEGKGQTETISVMNVYDSDFAWPRDTKIKALRIIQVLPKTTAPPNVPRIGVADQTNARAALGTVPVEEDGSAHFLAPVNKLIYFQALDEHGMAVMSMRSATYVHPGENLSCRGCHENKHNAPTTSRRAGRGVVGSPMALHRPPSEIIAETDGSNPFNYTRLVQPALDRNCVTCHREKKAVDLGGDIAGPNGWTKSYASLAAKHGFYFHVRNGSIGDGVHGGSRTIPGAFGARAAKLLDYMDERHYGVKLSDEDFRRLVVWLDCNSEFYGAYENIEAQARGEVVVPALE